MLASQGYLGKDYVHCKNLTKLHVGGAGAEAIRDPQKVTVEEHIFYYILSLGMKLSK